MSVISWLAYFISAVGAMNWGFTKFFKFNLVEYITQAAKVNYLNEGIYALVSVSGFYALIDLFVG